MPIGRGFRTESADRPMRVDGQHLRYLRENAGLTLTELARRSRISKAHLSMIETGIREPSPPVAARIAKVLDVAIVELRTQH